MNPHTFNTWVPPLEPVSLDPVEIWVPNEYFVQWWNEPKNAALMRSALKLSPSSPLRFAAGAVFSLLTAEKVL